MPRSLSATQAFRARYRSDVLPARYHGGLHLAFVLGVGAAGIGCALWVAAQSGRPVDLWVIPATLLIANAVEYLAHRGPMHHRVPGLRALHERHTVRHHHYFTAEAMHFESARDFHAVLFPPVLLLFFGAVVAALGAAAALFLTPAQAALFFATSLGYYLVYEILHFLYHVPPDWRAGRLPGVRWLARLHRLHHNPQRMQQRNFNLVFPLCDWIAGTLDTGRRTSSCHRHPPLN